MAPRPWNVVGLVACGLILTSSIGTAKALATAMKRSIVVSSVTATVVDEMQKSFVVLENRSDRALEAYRFQVLLDGQTVAAGWRDDCCFGAVSRQQPIAPHISVRLPIARTFGVSIGRPKSVVTLVVFDDGSFEGSRKEFDELVRQRAFVADDARYWRSVIVQQSDADFTARHTAFRQAYQTQTKSTSLGQTAGEALGIPQLVFAAGSSPQAYAAVADSTRVNLDAIERALRARLGAMDRR